MRPFHLRGLHNIYFWFKNVRRRVWRLTDTLHIDTYITWGLYHAEMGIIPACTLHVESQAPRTCHLQQAKKLGNARLCIARTAVYPFNLVRARKLDFTTSQSRLHLVKIFRLGWFPCINWSATVLRTLFDYRSIFFGHSSASASR